MTRLTDAELDALEAAERATTPRNWSDDRTPEGARLIALSLRHLPALLAEVRAYRALRPLITSYENAMRELMAVHPRADPDGCYHRRRLAVFNASTAAIVEAVLELFPEEAK